MARPTKSIETRTGHMTKEEIKARKEAEEKLRGLADNIKPPSYLNSQQKKIFKNIVKELERANILCNLDIYILAQCSIAIDRLECVEKLINEDIKNLNNKDLMKAKVEYTKDLYRCCNELSLSPASRAKIGSLNIQAKSSEEDPVLKVLRGDEV